ncbi:MAG: hypothetical protein ACON40_11260 [Ilumatobacteraceae bacterium]
MDGFQIQVGGRTRALGCLIAALPFLTIFGVGFVFWLFARMIGDAILPSGSSGFSEAFVGIVVIWLLLKLRKRLRARRFTTARQDDNRPTPPGVIDV